MHFLIRPVFPRVSSKVPTVSSLSVKVTFKDIVSPLIESDSQNVDQLLHGCCALLQCDTLFQPDFKSH